MHFVKLKVIRTINNPEKTQKIPKNEADTQQKKLHISD